MRVPTVHPRAGGEHICDSSRTHSSGGSSPRGRGTPVTMDDAPKATRFIPARAGNTCRARSRRGLVARFIPARAGNTIDKVASRGGCGSSPRGRGTLPRGARRRRSTENRFIPARAGNTVALRDARRGRPVHPRAGGEHVLEDDERAASRRFIPARAGNTPPRRRALRGRFIPARAGNTWRAPSASAYPPVHPRAGGEHGLDEKPDGTRFIPARAGNTPLCRHARDEGFGSSPRGRGTLFSQPSDSANLF